MKKKEIKELRSKTIKELETLIKKAKEEVVKLQFEHQTGKLKNAHLIDQKRHDLARVKTILKEKELLNEGI